jgi:hypothetical protein
MSVSPSFPQGAPSLAEVLITRTFAKPTNPFVDGEFLDALKHADDGETRAAVAPAKPGSGARSTPQDGETGETATHGPTRLGARIDVRV